MRITLIHASEPRQVHELALDVPEGTDSAGALRAAGWVARFPGIDAMAVAIWGRRVAADTLLREGDRVEFCRPLRVDPKVARRERFAGQGARAAGLFSARRPGSKAGY